MLKEVPKIRNYAWQPDAMKNYSHAEGKVAKDSKDQEPFIYKTFGSLCSTTDY